MKARDLMTQEVYTVRPDDGFNQVELIADMKHIRHVPVVDDNERVIGTVSVRDLLVHLSNAAASQFVPIREVMQSNVVTCGPDLPVEEVAALMLKESIGAVPIVEEEKIIGIISERDFVKHFSKG